MMRNFKTFLIIMCITTPLLFILSQFIRDYAAIMLTLLLYSVLVSYLVVSKHLKHLLLTMVLWSLSIWIVYYIVLTPSWILANGDLIVMSKVSEEIVMKGYYPFNNEYLLSIRPNYVLYPTSFMLQAILSIVTSINVRTLMYIPILMYAIYFSILLLVLSLLRETINTLSLFAVIPILSFIAPQTIYFVYSHVTRALLFLFLYIYVKVFFTGSGKKKVGASIAALALLAISSTLGHSQEPITFFIFLALFTLIVLPLQFRNEKHSYHLRFLLIPVYLFLSLVLAYNIYIATFVFQGIASLIKQILTTLLPRSSIEIITQKTSIAQGVLTREELILVAIGFGVAVIYATIFLLRHLINVIHNKSWYEMAFDLAILTYGLLAVLPLIMPGIGTDLFWRPLWPLFTTLALWPYIISQRQSVHYKQVKALHMLVLVIIVLFTFSNLLYMRLHLVSSSVYTHEALTITSIVKSSLIEYLKNAPDVKVIILDSPNQPAYEISRALMYLIPETKVEIKIQVLQPEVRWYANLSYLNGLAKLRGYNVGYHVVEEENTYNAYIFASTYDIPLIPAILTSKNIVFSFQDIITIS